MKYTKPEILHAVLRRTGVLVVLSVFLVSGVVSAQKFERDPLNYPYFDKGSSSACQNTMARIELSGKNLYMVGDSITLGSQTALETAFRQAGYSIEVNGYNSRSLSEGSRPTDGRTVIQNSTAQIQGAAAVIVALGTNGGLTAASIEATVNDVKGINSEARIIWVNIGADNTKRSAGGPIDTESINSVLNETARNVQPPVMVVDWARVVAGNLDLIKSDTYGVHPSDGEGTEAFASTIVSVITGKTPPTGGGSGCVAAEGCAENEKAVWDFFSGKGLDPHMIAGFMGNMREEAHFEPRLVEYGWRNSRGEISRAGQESSLDLEIPPNQNEKGQPGYGIIQFTSPGRKDHLQQVADELGLPPCDLGVQLEAVWRELEGPYRESTLDPVRATTNAGDAAEIITRNYEIPGRMEAAVSRRRVGADEFLAKYGSGGL